MIEKELTIECPKCNKAELVMTEIFYMSWFGCPKCNAVFYSNGYDLVETKK